MYSVGFISDKTLRNILQVDIYGFYLKDGVHIPTQCIKQYNKLKHKRERNILRALNIDNIPLIKPIDTIPFIFRLKSFLLRCLLFKAIYKFISINSYAYPEICDIITLKQLLQRGNINENKPR